MNELTQSITEKVKKYLNIQEDIDLFALYDIVYECLKKSHPDQFEENFKKEAEERFKTLNNLLSELKREIDYLKLTKRPSEIVIYERNFDLVKTKNEVLLLREETNNLNDKLKNKEYEIGKLNAELEKVNSARYKESLEELTQLYKPTKSGILALSISSIIILFISITTQFDTFYKKLSAFSPIEPSIINWILFVILIVTFLIQVLRIFKKNKLKKICDILIASSTIKNFFDCKVKTDESKYYVSKYFTEIDVEDFIKNNFCSPKHLKGLVYHFERFFLIDDHKSINYLKNVFIDNLFCKKFISYGNSKDLERNFVIK